MPPPHLASLLRPAIDPALVAQPAPAPSRKPAPRRQTAWLRPTPTEIPKALPLPRLAPEPPVPERPAPERAAAPAEGTAVATRAGTAPARPRLALPSLPRPTLPRLSLPRAVAATRHATPETPRHQLVWLTALAILLLGPLAHIAGALGLPGSSTDVGLLIGLPWAELPAAILFWGTLLLPAVALATWRKAEPVAIVVVATFWAWSGLHHAAAQGWLPASVPPLPFG